MQHPCSARAVAALEPPPGGRKPRAVPAAGSRRRSEADGVLRLHRQRLQALEARLALGAPAVLALGVLMLVPEEAHHAA